MEQQTLTDKQRDVLKFIYEQIRGQQLAPTIREIGEHFGFSSTGTVRDYLKALVDKGYIRIQEGKSRAIELVKEALFQVPVLDGFRQASRFMLRKIWLGILVLSLWHSLGLMFLRFG